MKKVRRLEWVDGLRGAAMVAVVAFHTTNSAMKESMSVVYEWLRRGDRGVQLFL